MRILFATREPHPTFRADVAVLFGKYLPRLGIFTDLLAPGSYGDCAESEWGGGLAWTAHPPIGGGIGKRIAYFTADCRMLLRAAKGYDAIQVRDRPFGALIALFAARIARIPCFYWMSFPFPEAWLDAADDARRNGDWLRSIPFTIRGALGHWILYRLVLPRVDHVFVQSERMREDVAAHGIPVTRMTAVSMGVDVEAINDLLKPADDPRLVGRRVIVYLGALERIRHPEIMIDAVAKIREEFPDVLLALAGDAQRSEERAWLDGYIATRGLGDHVIITGWLPTREAWRYVHSAEIGLSPFPRTRVLESASPTKVPEYFAVGRPVVANDHPEQAALVQESGGGVCVCLTAEGFAQGISALLSDPQEAQRKGSLGQAYVSQARSYAVIAAQVARAYSNLFTARQASATAS